MLEPAIKYKDLLENIYYETWFNDKYKFFFTYPYHNKIEIKDNTWEKHQFVSVSNHKIIGFIQYSIDRTCDVVHGLQIISFIDNTITFGIDLKKAIQDIFEKFHFRKLKFVVVIGNPVEKSYDKLIKRYGGRIVGIMKEEFRLIDGKYYDAKLYEITFNEYINGRTNK